MNTPAWLDKILSDPVATATLILALVTVFLAVGAFLSILQNHNLQKRERKERLLNEIIEWAEDISRGRFDKDMNDFVSAIEDARRSAHITIEEYNSYSKQFMARNKYIISSASGIDEQLKQSVEELDALLRIRLEGTIPYLNDRDRNKYSSPFKNKLKIYESANRLIEEAAKIKTKAIS